MVAAGSGLAGWKCTIIAVLGYHCVGGFWDQNIKKQRENMLEGKFKKVRFKKSKYSK